jgi:4-hydroxy-tetrahydrodipicolinate synthase
MTRSWRGIFTILLTPFDDDRALDLESLRREVDFVVAAGVHGIVSPVNSSEFYLLSDEERRQLVEAVVARANGRVPVVVGVGASNASTAEALAHHAREVGAAGVIAMPPYVLRPSADVMRDYFARIARAADGLPLVLQNAGGEVGVPLASSVVVELAREIPAIRYVKEETVPAPHRISELLRLGGDALDGVFGSGTGGRHLVNEWRRGACGMMSACHLADAQVKVYEAFASGDEAAARTVLGRQLPAQNLWQLLGLGLAKEILRRRGVFATAVCRRSVAALDAADHEELDHALELVREDCLSLEGVA